MQKALRGTSKNIFSWARAGMEPDIAQKRRKSFKMHPSFGICRAMRQQRQVWWDTHSMDPHYRSALYWSLAMRSLQFDVSLSSLGCSVTEQRDHPCRTRRRTCQVTFTCFPVAGVQCSTAVITSEEEKVHFCKWLWTVLRKLHSCINSTSNISYERNKVQECNQSFWHKTHTTL